MDARRNRWYLQMRVACQAFSSCFCIRLFEGSSVIMILLLRGPLFKKYFLLTITLTDVNLSPVL